MEANETLQKIEHANGIEFTGSNAELNKKAETLLSELDEFMNDDFNTAKVLANLFDLVPIINSVKDKHIPLHEFSRSTFELLTSKFKTYVEECPWTKGGSGWRYRNVQRHNTTADRHQKRSKVKKGLRNIRQDPPTITAIWNFAEG